MKKKIRVLIIDDSAVVRNVFSKELGKRAISYHLPAYFSMPSFFTVGSSWLVLHENSIIDMIKIPKY